MKWKSLFRFISGEEILVEYYGETKNNKIIVY